MRPIAIIFFLSLLFACKGNEHRQIVQDNNGVQNNNTASSDTGPSKPNESQPVMTRLDSNRTVSVGKYEDISFANGRRPAYMETKPFWVGGKIKNGGLGN